MFQGLMYFGMLCCGWSWYPGRYLLGTKIGDFLLHRGQSFENLKCIALTCRAQRGVVPQFHAREVRQKVQKWLCHAYANKPGFLPTMCGRRAVCRGPRGCYPACQTLKVMMSACWCRGCGTKVFFLRLLPKGSWARRRGGNRSWRTRAFRSHLCGIWIPIRYIVASIFISCLPWGRSS